MPIGGDARKSVQRKHKLETLNAREREMGLGKVENILIVHNYYQIPGGEDTVIANEKKMLEENGHKVFFYSRNNSELKTMKKLQKLFLPITTVFNPKTYREIKKIIREQKIDIVHVHNTLNLISPAVYYAALKCKVPVVQTVHNFRMVCPGATFYRNGHICEDCREHGLICALEHNCYRGSKLQTLACVISTKFHRMTGVYKKLNYICLTEYTKGKISSIVPEKQIYVKPNFVYDFGGQSDPSDYYVFVGRIEEIKGIRVLVEAFKKMPDRKLYVVGTGDLNDEIRKRIEDEGIQNVLLLGYKERDEVNRIIRGAKALIMCSQWYETFGMVIVEAYSNGTPAIVGDIGNIKDLVDEGVTGELFKYDSSESLVDAVSRFENNTAVLYGDNAYKFYQSKYTPEVNYKQLISVYDCVRKD